MKKLFLTSAVLLAAMTSMAQTATFSAADVTGEKYGSVTLTVEMQNDFDARDFQCFIDLPEGITPEMNANNRPAVAWSGRQGDHMLSSSFSKGQCRVIGFSASGSTIAGNSGALFALPLTLNVAPGEYEVRLSNIYVSTMAGTDVAVPDATAKITVIVYPERIALSKNETEILIGGSETLTATLAPDDVTESTITWTSSDESVATVADGLVTAVGVGSATITATTVNGKSAQCAVKVNPILATAITLDATSIELFVDETARLAATITPTNTTDKTLTWTSSDESVLTVADGLVTAVGVGSATVTATTVNGVSAFCAVKVNPVMATGITIEGGDIEVFIGASASLNVIFTPANTTDKTLTWTSSDTNIITVADGEITAVGVGSATVTATTTNGMTASINVKVNEIVITSVTLDVTSALLKEGETVLLTATILPEDATFTDLIWTSSDESVATVADGLVTSVGRGTATITATTPNKLTASCDVQVVINGDANDNGMVSIADATVTVNHILGKDVPATFVERAADANDDGSVTVTDVAMIANIILGVEPAGPRAAPAMALGNDHFLVDEEISNAIYLRLSNQGSYLAMQCDVELPLECEISQVELLGANGQSHVASYNMLDEQHARIVVYSLTNSYFADGDILRVIFATPLENEGEWGISVDGTLIVDGRMNEYEVAHTDYRINNKYTGLAALTADSAEAVYYTLDGIRVSSDHLAPGFYIVAQNGTAKKVLIK